MALYHHDSRDYEVAAAEAARHARRRFEAQIADGQASTAAVVRRIIGEVPVDRIVAAKAIEFVPSKDDPTLYVEVGDTQEVVTDHALEQIAERVRMAGTYVTHLRSLGAFGAELLAHNLNELYRREEKRRFLLRSFNGRLRGFLSDTYRRLDSRPIVEAFAEEVQALGGLFVQGQATETKVALQVLLPTIYEPVAHEPCTIGAYLRNSDYGDGRVDLGSLIDRIWCTNKAITSSEYGQVHLGKRLGDSIEYSQKTYELDTAATVSAVRDIVRKLLSPPAVQLQLDTIKAADAEKVDPHEINTWLKKRTTKTLAARVVETFNSPDVELLPPGNTKWRFSNALSLLARDAVADGDRMELEKLAGEVLDGVKARLPKGEVEAVAEAVAS